MTRTSIKMVSSVGGQSGRGRAAVDGGRWARRRGDPSLAILPLAAAQLVLMRGLLDAWLPRAMPAVTGALKGSALIVLVLVTIVWCDQLATLIG